MCTINHTMSGVFSRIFLSFSLLFLLASCQNEDTLGLDLQPPSDLLDVQYTDTISLIAYSVLEDSLRTDETSQNLVGYYNDPQFGPVRADFCSQIRLSSSNVNFGTGAEIDSIVLGLDYYSIYGNSKQDSYMTLYVHELLSEIFPDSTYYSNEPFQKGELLGYKSFTPHLEDSVLVNNVFKAPHLRMPLSNNFGKRLMDASSQGYLIDNTAFLNYFKGICVSSSSPSSGGSILSFELLSALSCVTLYYHNDNDTLSYVFEINQNCARYNYFDHFGYASANPNLLQQINGDTALGDSRLFLQPMAGVKIKIRFPYIKDLAALSDVSIDRAELIIPVDQSDATAYTYEKPTKLSLVRIADDGGLEFLPDQIYTETTFDGNYYSDSKFYRFVITRHIQNLVSGEVNDNGLYLMVSGSAIRANRLLVNGPGGIGNQLRLRIVYTRIN